MKPHLALKLIGVAWLLSACVTINVYFPAAAAEQAADKFIESVWGGEEGSKPKSTGAPEKSSSVTEQIQRGILLAAINVLDFVIPAAHAQADLNIETPPIRQLRESMKARHAQLSKFYDSGAVGLTGNGLVDVRDLNLVPLPERTAVRKWVAEENADRNNLYREIASANGHPEWEADIRSTFAQRWVLQAASGWYYQDGGDWKKK